MLRRINDWRYCAFLRAWTLVFPPELDVHLVVDNCATSQTSQGAYLAGTTVLLPHALHPTYSSWLNHVERWFGLVTQRATRRGSFGSVKERMRKIGSFVQNYNRTHRPFIWTADSILQKIVRLCSRISGTRN